MAASRTIPLPVESIDNFVLFIAKVIRDDMEAFHVKYSLQEAMGELNPLIRNAVYSACYVFLIQEQSPAARKYVKFKLRSVPAYWEAPKLTDKVRQFLTESGQ